MIVTLTHAGGRVVLDRVPELHRERMLEHRQPHGKSQHRYTLPAIAWQQIHGIITKDAWGPAGGARQDQPKSLYTAITALTDTIMRHVHHPAMYDGAVGGVNADIIPAWRIDVVYDRYGDRRYSDTPSGDEFVLLVPRCTMLSGHTITHWLEQPSRITGYTFKEEDHIEFAIWETDVV